MIRLIHGGVALGFGAADALISAKVATSGPFGVPVPVLLEGAAVAAGLWGDKVGLPADVRDPLLLSALGLAGARLTKVALRGQLASGPRAWGGDLDLAADAGGRGGDAGRSGAIAQLPARSGVRMLPGRVAVGGAFSLYPGAQESAGVAG